MKKLTLLVGLLFVVGFAFSQNNLSEVYQDGDWNIATVSQIGVNNTAYLDMLGNYNTIWQCQTGHGNGLMFVINNGDWNATYQGVMWTPWHYMQFGVHKFFICQLWDPSNTQHQYGHFNYAETFIDYSSGNLVSQAQGWKYHPFASLMTGPVVGNFNHAGIYISGGSNNNLVMQAQLMDANYAMANIHNESEYNVSLQYQYGYWNTSDVEILDYSNDNWVATCQVGGCNWAWVDIWFESDFNEVIINQYDCGNFAHVLVDWYSDHNKVAIYQENYGWGNTAKVFIYTDADYNEMSICQWDWGSHYAMIDIYKGDYNNIYTWYDGFFGVPLVFGDKVYTEIFWDYEYNVIRQEGSNHYADIYIHQTGCGAMEQADFNKVAIWQWGPWSFDNYASIWIYNSNFNRAAIAQTGYWNTALIDIMWNSDYNIAAISQWADNQYAYIQQINGSEYNMANIVQGDSWYDDGFNEAYILQNYHANGLAIINQFWKHNYASIVQEFGSDNQATIYQKSFGSWANIYETGSFNFAAICQHYFGFHHANIYINGFNNGFHNLIEGTNPYFKPSNPGYHNGAFFKVENWVCFDPTNMIRQEGKCNWADMWIYGDNNRSSIYQKGYPMCGGCGGCCMNNQAYLHIDGNGNWTAQYQEGAYNYSDIYIEDAHYGKALTFQVGVANWAAIYQFDGEANMAGIDQFGCFHHGYIQQTGFANEATINQFNWNPHGN